jgi:hypothetical protein
VAVVVALTQTVQSAVMHKTSHTIIVPPYNILCCAHFL